MVFVTSEHFQQVYQWIKDDSLSGSCSTLILCTPECDALCACRILTVFFRRKKK
jgi:hypothetical protein